MFQIDHVSAHGADGAAGVGVVPTLGAAVASLTFMMTIAPSAARLLIVSVAGMPATLLDTVASTEARSEQWQLIAPPIGTGQARVTLAATTLAVHANGMAFAGVNHVTPVRTVVRGGGSADSASLTIPTADGDLVESTVGQGAGISGPASLAGGGAFLDNVDARYALNNAAGSTALGHAPSITMGWTFVTTDSWQMIVASIEPDVAPAAAMR